MMKPKMILTVVLLLFVVLSIATVVMRETATTTETAPKIPQVTTEDQEVKDTVIVYYFHGNMRCKTCKTIEAYTRESLETAYGDELKNGGVILKVVNLEITENEHFINKYQLTNRSVVLSKIQNDKEIKWDRLDKVWELVSDKAAFCAYIKEHTALLLKKES